MQPQFPSPDLSTLLAGVGSIFAALMVLWGIRKVIKLINRS